MSKIFYFCGSEQFQPEELIEHAVLAEKVGFDGIMLSEHFNPWVTDVGAAGFAFATLGAIAARTKRIQLITGVTTPLFRYHPAIVAQAAATIDRISNGRFLLGIGTGESLNEVPLGMPFPKYQERAERMEEALYILHELLAGKKLSFKGKYYATQEAKLYSPPIGSIPLFMAAGGPKSVSLASKAADGIITSVKNVEETKALLKPTFDQIHTKPFLLFATRWSVYAQNENEAYQSLQAWRGLRVPSRDKATDPLELQKEADTLPHSQIINYYTTVSSAQGYIDAYAPLISDLHADCIAIQTTGINQKAIIKLLGEAVLPELRIIQDKKMK